MTGKEVIKTMLRLFLPIWGVMLFFAVSSLIIADHTFISLGEASLFLLTSLACTLSIALHYSSKELTKWQMLLRYILHCFVVVGIALLVFYLGWQHFKTIHLPIYIPVIIVGYCIVVLVDEMHTKRLTTAFKKD